MWSKGVNIQESNFILLSNMEVGMFIIIPCIHFRCCMSTWICATKLPSRIGCLSQNQITNTYNFVHYPYRNYNMKIYSILLL